MGRRVLRAWGQEPEIQGRAWEKGNPSTSKSSVLRQARDESRQVQRRGHLCWIALFPWAATSLTEPFVTEWCLSEVYKKKRERSGKGWWVGGVVYFGKFAVNIRISVCEVWPGPGTHSFPLQLSPRFTAECLFGVARLGVLLTLGPVCSPWGLRPN